jgi:hypothetical protein
LTLDHVVPQCLFPSPHPPDMPKIWACEPCNNEKARSDSYLRDMLATAFPTQHYATAKLLVPKFHRSRSRRQSDLAQDAMKGHLIDVYTPSGIYSGQAFRAYLPADRVMLPLTWIVKGLHYAYLGEPLPSETRLDFDCIPDLAVVNAVLPDWVRRGIARQHQIGDGAAFTSVLARRPDVPDMMLWILCFYQRVAFAVGENTQAILGYLAS